MKATGKNPREASEIVAALDIAIETLAAFDLTGDRRAQARRAEQALDRILSLIGHDGRSDSLPGFRQRVAAARHCLTMGKPRECLRLVEELKTEMQGAAAD
jgi:GTP cyclohydrolase I